ncbi:MULTISPECIES: hypothetical protein [unclassified Mesorhizobium]|uniref:hypothetical protein n=1 Tax=unclassified Mesorhizobium TaxID=325217 RepID=UPI0010934C75|nr:MULTISPECIES: hypothetical protein [unclassified Mesorhizobium]TGS46256.1 hypothetical protein EN825_11635 [Mesorhizobium sp. M8A.F.Ca.ET.182.01.1.1]TGS81714.1 hypothetical protein EN824_11865 [Mesorhizobium sp. M8A.F.Ca.ET.181.01.1.1]
MNRHTVGEEFSTGLLRNLPLYAFAAFTLTGCIFIAVSKLWGVNPFVSMTVPIMLMIGYLSLSWFSGRIRLHEEQTGDNLYYMGFLFTLSSLGVSLYQFTSVSSTDDVIRNFGIAITSTIFGIALRILYNQTRRDVLDVERATRHELATMTRRVRSEMESATREFADFRRVSNQMISEGFEEIVRHADDTGEQLKGALEKMANEAIKPVQDASAKLSAAIDASFGQIASKLSEIAEKVDSSGDLFEQANSGMASSTSQLGSQVDAVARKLEAVMIPEAVLKNELGPLVRELGKIVVDYGARTEALSKDQAHRMDLITNAAAKIVETSGRSLQIMEKSLEASAHVQRSTDNLARHVQQQNADMQKLLEKMLFETRAVAKPGVFEPLSDGVAAASNGAVHHFGDGLGATPLLDDIVAVAAPVEVQAAQPNGRDARETAGDAVSPVDRTVESEPDSKRWWNRR